MSRCLYYTIVKVTEENIEETYIYIANNLILWQWSRADNNVRIKSILSSLSSFIGHFITGFNKSILHSDQQSHFLQNYSITVSSFQIYRRVTTVKVTDVSVFSLHHCEGDWTQRELFSEMQQLKVIFFGDETLLMDNFI